MKNQLLVSTFAKAVEPREIGSILDLSISMESSTPISASIIGGTLFQGFAQRVQRGYAGRRDRLHVVHHLQPSDCRPSQIETAHSVYQFLLDPAQP